MGKNLSEGANTAEKKKAGPIIFDPRQEQIKKTAGEFIFPLTNSPYISNPNAVLFKSIEVMDVN